MFEYQNLHRSLTGVGAACSQEIFDLLDHAYGEPSRHYHDRSHVASCLAEFEKYRDLAERPHEIEVALWFHDAIYDTSKSDNEEQSATWAERYLLANGAASDVAHRIAAMIRATRTHIAEDEDSRLMVDIDLGILGTPVNVFEQYDRNIRLEYHWVPEAQYRAGRSRVLGSFLERDTIYQTAVIRTRYEQRARENLERKLRELES